MSHSAERVLAARHRDEHPLAGLDHVEVVDRLGAPGRGTVRRKCSAQKLALWRRMSMTAGPRHTRHFIAAAAPEITGRISTVVVVGEALRRRARACRRGSPAPTRG